MIAFEDIEPMPETKETLVALGAEVKNFRQEGPLDRVALAKLEEHFRVSHIYHSAGIEVIGLRCRRRCS